MTTWPSGRNTEPDISGRERPGAALDRRFEYENLSVRKGNLTEEEYREIQSHVTHTHNIVRQIPFTPELARVPVFAAAHHEMLNGTGYPKGLKIFPYRSRPASWRGGHLRRPDCFRRPYKPAMPVERAVAILRDEARAGRLDPDLVELFVQSEVWKQMAAESPEGVN